MIPEFVASRSENGVPVETRFIASPGTGIM